MSQDEIYDIIIIGGGPVGLFSAFYAGMRSAKTLIIESLPQLGGQLRMLYPEKHIFDVAGFPNISAGKLIDNLIKQNERFYHTIALNESVLAIEKITEAHFVVKTTRQTYHSKTVIISAGNGAFEPRRLALEEASYCEGQSLHYYIDNLEQFRNKSVMITGGGDSAIDWSLMLEPIAREVTLVHRRTTFRGHEHSVEQLLQSTVQLKTPFVIDAIAHQNGVIESVQLHNPKEGIVEKKNIDALIVNFGYSSSLGAIKEWPVTFKGKQIIVSSDMSTDTPGIYAIGDICYYPGKVNLIATGFGEAPTAVNNALHYANPKERLQPGHSTSLFKD